MFTELHLARTLWRYALTRARAARINDPVNGRDRGASALEWAVISAIVVTAAVVIGGIVVKVVQDKGSTLERCANQPVGANGC
jgi:hypothetical protein